MMHNNWIHLFTGAVVSVGFNIFFMEEEAHEGNST